MQRVCQPPAAAKARAADRYRSRPSPQPRAPPAGPAEQGAARVSLAGRQDVRRGAMPRRWPSRVGSIEQRGGFQRGECPFVCEPCARLALMRQLFVAGLSTSSGLVDSLT